MEYTKDDVLQYVAENDVKFIKLFYSDILGSLKSLTIQPSMLASAFEDGVSFDGSSVRGFTSIENSDLLLVPDPTTLSVLPWRPQHGRVVRMYCNIMNVDGTPYESDGRKLLQDAEKRAKSMGYGIQVGTECEFYLFKLNEKSEPTAEPYDYAGYCDLAPMDKGENVRRDIIVNLEQMGIVPLTSHHETGPGQNEIDFKYSSAVHAADNFQTFKTTVNTIAAKNGLYASFMPKPLSKEAGSGLHINISLTKNGENIFNMDNEESRNFVAGVLAYSKDYSMFLNPVENSYDRLGEFEAPKYISWANQNRSCLVRIPSAKGENARMELRSPDPMCSPYIAFALIINAGLDGIKNKMSLMPKAESNLYNLKDNNSTYDKLWDNFNEASEASLSSEFVKKVIGENATKKFVESAIIASKAQSEINRKLFDYGTMIIDEA